MVVVLVLVMMMMSFWIFSAESVLVDYGFFNPAAPERHPTARGRATVPRTPLI